MWTKLPTAGTAVDCRPPYSFFFDLIGAYFRASAGNSSPLHRICTLARKQDAQGLLIADALPRSDVCEEINALDASYGGGGTAEAVSFSFFDAQIALENIDQIKSSSLLGQVILINYKAPQAASFSHSYVFEAVMRPPMVSDGAGAKQRLLNNFVFRDAEFAVDIAGREFKIEGIYYAQQNGRTNVCAHACLRMAINTFNQGRIVSSVAINEALQIGDVDPGLQIGQIEKIIQEKSGAEALVVDCRDLGQPNYLSILSSIIESGNLALLVFTTGENNVEHVVTVFGHTKNSDEWHPQALPVYAGPHSAPYFGGSQWIDHLLIHDDNFGPYFSLSARALEVNRAVKPHWVIGLYKKKPNVNAAAAELIGAIYLAGMLPGLAPHGRGRWFERVTRNALTFVTRPLLISRDQYVEHLRQSKDHYDGAFSEEDLVHLNRLPDIFWIVEFSLPDLYVGNHSKLGEVVIDALNPIDSKDLAKSLLMLRVPGVIAIADNVGAFEIVPTSLSAHSPLFMMRPVLHRW